MEFQNRLYSLRKKSGLSQEELAGLLGVTRQAVQKWESGASRPDMDNLVSLARYFNVTLDWLVTGQEQEQAPAPSTVVIEKHFYPMWHYEYKSRASLFGLPLVHIHFGPRLCRARGVLAVGNLATGMVALGGMSVGLFSLGGLSLGLLAVGGMAAGGVAVGGLAVGAVALGGLSLGWLALGGAANGCYAVGGLANATQVAIGGVANAPVAIGDQASGALALAMDGSVPLQTIQAAIRQGTAQAPGWLQNLLCSLAAHF